jgi:putative salt-induced outer membrane protein YdiY
MMRIVKMFVLCLLIATMSHGVARAQDEEAEKRWSNSADLSLVATEGNSQTVSWALSDKFTYTWTNQQIRLEGSALRTETTARSLSNVGGDVEVDENTTTTAEEYWLGGQFRQRIFMNLFAYTTGRWYRNELSGIKNRTAVSLGVGYLFFETPRHTLTAELGGDWTNEEQVEQGSRDFFGAQAIFDYTYKITETATFEGDLAILPNLDDTEDLRVNTALSVSAAISSVFALKVSYVLLFDNQPVEVVVPGTPPDADALFTFDKYDHRLAASLVMNL